MCIYIYMYIYIFHLLDIACVCVYVCVCVCVCEKRGVYMLFVLMWRTVKVLSLDVHYVVPLFPKVRIKEMTLLDQVLPKSGVKTYTYRLYPFSPTEGRSRTCLLFLIILWAGPKRSTYIHTYLRTSLRLSQNALLRRLWKQLRWNVEVSCHIIQNWQSMDSVMLCLLRLSHSLQPRVKEKGTYVQLLKYQWSL